MESFLNEFPTVLTSCNKDRSVRLRSACEMSISPKICVISLLSEKNRDTLLLKNWRPITLLNIENKNTSKCIEKRLQKVLPKLTNRDQTGYVKNRFIEENIWLISDIIESYEEKSLPGMLLFINFEKAFDFLEWNYPFKVFEVMPELWPYMRVHNRFGGMRDFAFFRGDIRELCWREEGISITSGRGILCFYGVGMGDS